MSIQEEVQHLTVQFPFRKKLIEDGDAFYVTISHKELDNLIGSLMGLCDLNSDSVYREALKSEIKMRSRRWLDDEYSAAGYENYAVQTGANIINLRAIANSLNREPNERKR